jgi:hypothetical protein
MKPAPPSATRRYAFGAGPVKDGTWRRGPGQLASDAEVAARKRGGERGGRADAEPRKGGSWAGTGMAS